MSYEGRQVDRKVMGKTAEIQKKSCCPEASGQQLSN